MCPCVFQKLMRIGLFLRLALFDISEQGTEILTAEEGNPEGLMKFWLKLKPGPFNGTRLWKMYI